MCELYEGEGWGGGERERDKQTVTHRERQTDSQRQKQRQRLRERERQTQRERQTDRETDRHKDRQRRKQRKGETACIILCLCFVCNCFLPIVFTEISYASACCRYDGQDMWMGLEGVGDTHLWQDGTQTAWRKWGSSQYIESLLRL